MANRGEIETCLEFSNAYCNLNIYSFFFCEIQIKHKIIIIANPSKKQLVNTRITFIPSNNNNLIIWYKLSKWQKKSLSFDILLKKKKEKKERKKCLKLPRRIYSIIRQICEKKKKKKNSNSLKREFYSSFHVSIIIIIIIIPSQKPSEVLNLNVIIHGHLRETFAYRRGKPN